MRRVRRVLACRPRSRGGLCGCDCLGLRRESGPHRVCMCTRFVSIHLCRWHAVLLFCVRRGVIPFWWRSRRERHMASSCSATATSIASSSILVRRRSPKLRVSNVSASINVTFLALRSVMAKMHLPDMVEGPALRHCGHQGARSVVTDVVRIKAEIHGRRTGSRGNRT